MLDYERSVSGVVFIMRLNYDTVLAGPKAVLVPYRPEHVPTYHKWMLDPHLLEMVSDFERAVKNAMACIL